MLVMLAIVVSSIIIAWRGIDMHQQVAVEEAAFYQLQTEYFSVSKAERDAALSNSELTGQLVEIANYPSELLRLKLVGVGKILTGIFILLLGILIALIVMPTRLKMAIKG